MRFYVPVCVPENEKVENKGQHKTVRAYRIESLLQQKRPFDSGTHTGTGTHTSIGMGIQFKGMYFRRCYRKHLLHKILKIET